MGGTSLASVLNEYDASITPTTYSTSNSGDGALGRARGRGVRREGAQPIYALDRRESGSWLMTMCNYFGCETIGKVVQ
jgi:hypothetical protein